jgi:hypothetical protein
MEGGRALDAELCARRIFGETSLTAHRANHARGHPLSLYHLRRDRDYRAVKLVFTTEVRQFDCKLIQVETWLRSKLEAHLRANVGSLMAAAFAQSHSDGGRSRESESGDLSRLI